MKRPLQIQKFLSQKRERRRLREIAAERLLRREWAKRRENFPTYHPKTLKILQKHIPDGIYGGKDKIETIKIPENFSIIDDTEGALNSIYQLVAFATRRPPPREIRFDHSNLTTFDLAAEGILDTVAVTFRQERRRTKGKLVLRGTFPLDAAANRFIRAVGIIKNLQLQQYFLRRDEEQALKILRRMSYKARLRVSEQSPSERAARDLVDYFNDCLTVGGFELTKGARHNLALYAGEVLDNAAQHSETDEWVLVGYLDLATSDHICELTIFNFGKTFADTFLTLPPDHYTRTFVDPFVDLHRSKGFFGSGWTPANLLTVAALQGYVSCKNESDQDTRGNGTVDLINFFQRVHRATLREGMEPPRMAIISGETVIYFDGRHSMAPDKMGRPIIAFNSQNTLEKPPDHTHVKCLRKVKFPGTIVSIRFPLPSGVTREVSNNDGE